MDSILEIYLNEKHLENILLLLKHIPQYFDEWPSHLKQKIENLFKHQNSKVRSSILLLLSPTWINEELLIAGLHDKNETVQNAAIQSAAILFQKIDENFRNKIYSILKSSKLLKSESYGFFIGYNFNLNDFGDEIETILSSKGVNAVGFLINCLKGLILNWSSLPQKIKELIVKNSMENWSKTVKKSIYESFRLYLGILDNQGRDLVEFLSNENSFLWTRKIANFSVKLSLSN
jgi:hypothetical protein